MLSSTSKSPIIYKQFLIEGENSDFELKKKVEIERMNYNLGSKINHSNVYI